VGFSASPAHAHAVKVDYKFVGTELVIVAYFDTDLPADDAAVTLRGPDGTVVATGKTDDTGTWKCPKPAPGTYQLHVKAFGSHEKTVPIPIEAPPVEPTERPSPSESGWVWVAAGVMAIVVTVLGAGLWAWRRRRKRATNVSLPLD
jgi:hypothetical protein